MAPRSARKRYLELSLVTCPVQITPATSESEKISFHSLNRAAGNRVRDPYVDSGTGKMVRDEDRVQGVAKGGGGHFLPGLGDGKVRPAPSRPVSSSAVRSPCRGTRNS